MFVQTQLHLFFKIISLWSMSVCRGGVYSWEGLFVVTLTDIDIIRASWLDPDDEFWSGCQNVSQCHHKHSFSGLHSPGWSYFTNLWYDSWVQTFYKITTGLNHLHPNGLAHRSCCLWISCNMKLFLSRFSLKIRFLQSHLVENRP